METPMERWAKRAAKVRLIEPHVDIDDLFLWEQKRKVRSDRTVSLNGVMYEVAAELVGQNVLLRHDPAAPKGPILVYNLQTREHFGQAKVVDLYANTKVKRQNLAAISFAKLNPKEK